MLSGKDDSLKLIFERMDLLIKSLDAVILLKKDELKELSLNESKRIE